MQHATTIHVDAELSALLRQFMLLTAELRN
jgi:hypothetical protein